MMYYNCENCSKPIKKPYPSKKYCSVGCREASRKSRVEEQEQAFWNSIRLLEIPPEDEQVLSQLAEGHRAGILIQRYAPAGSVGYRVGCRKVGAEHWNFTVHWFPSPRERSPALFRLDPLESPIAIPCPNEYAVAYFNEAGRLVYPPRFKLLLRARSVNVLWSDGDRRLLLDSKPR